MRQHHHSTYHIPFFSSWPFYVLSSTYLILSLQLGRGFILDSKFFFIDLVLCIFLYLYSDSLASFMLDSIFCSSLFHMCLIVYLFGLSIFSLNGSPLNLSWYLPFFKTRITRYNWWGFKIVCFWLSLQKLVFYLIFLVQTIHKISIISWIWNYFLFLNQKF